MNLSEAEIQVLASLQAAELDAAPTDRATLEKGGERFWIFLEDWSEAFAGLIAKGLIVDETLGFDNGEVVADFDTITTVIEGSDGDQLGEQDVLRVRLSAMPSAGTLPA